MRKYIWIIIILAVIVLSGLAYYAESTKGIPVQAAQVRTGRISTYVEERARTTLPNIYRLTMPLSGRIKPIRFKEGDRVQAGQVVAEMDDSDLRTAVALAESRLEQINAQIILNKFKELEKTALEESDSIIKATIDTVKASKAKILASQEELRFADWWLEALKKLDERGDTAKMRLKAAQKEFVQARVDVANDQFISSAVLAIKEAVDLGPKYIRQWLNRKELQLDVLEEQKNEARISLAQAERELKRASIKSPVDGVVLKRYVEFVRVLPAGALLLEIGRLEELQVTAEILTQDAVLIKAGQPVQIYGAAIGPESIKGQVLQVDPQGLTKLSSLGVEQQRVQVKIAFDKEDLKILQEKGRSLGLAYRVRVRIITGSKDKALIVPRPALFRGPDGQWQMFIIREQKAELITVRVGLANDQEAEILSGLKTDDTVIVAPPKTLNSGTKVDLGNNRT